MPSLSNLSYLTSHTRCNVDRTLWRMQHLLADPGMVKCAAAVATRWASSVGRCPCLRMHAMRQAHCASKLSLTTALAHAAVPGRPEHCGVRRGAGGRAGRAAREAVLAGAAPGAAARACAAAHAAVHDPVCCSIQMFRGWRRC